MMFKKYGDQYEIKRPTTNNALDNEWKWTVVRLAVRDRFPLPMIYLKP